MFSIIPHSVKTTFPWLCLDLALMTFPGPRIDFDLTLQWPCLDLALDLPWPCWTLIWPCLELVLSLPWACLNLALTLSWSWLDFANLPLKLVKIGIVTAEIFLIWTNVAWANVTVIVGTYLHQNWVNNSWYIWTNVARANVAWTNVTVTVYSWNLF